MRRIAASGGLELGPSEGPWIDVVPLPPVHPVTMDEIAEATAAGLQWHPWQEVAARMKEAPYIRHPNMKGVIGMGKTLSIRFLYFLKQEPASALRVIEEHERGLPPALAGAVLAAARARRYPVEIAPLVIAHACALQPQAAPTHFSRKELEQMADTYIRSLIHGGDVDIPQGAVDRARFWLLVARKLWEPKTRFLIARTSPSPAMLMPGSLAAAWLELRALDAIEIAGVTLSLPPESYSMAWPQVLEWDRGGITDEALRYLTDGQVPVGEPTVDRPSRIDEPLPTDAQDDLCKGLTAALLREAAEQGVYAPVGAFTLALPRDYPLRAWGVKALRVWAEPDGLWAAVINQAGQIGVSFHWRPGEPLSRWVISEPAAPLVALTCAALWRDLRVAGEEAVPGSTTRRKRAGKSKGKRKRPSARRRPVRTLPARRVRLTGRRTWGSGEEHAHIRRRAHAVRGHLRRLAPGWHASHQARELARQFGIVVPDGFTFVRPHVRGGKGKAQEPTGVVVRAKGLASVMTLLGTGARRHPGKAT